MTTKVLPMSPTPTNALKKGKKSFQREEEHSSVGRVWHKNPISGTQVDG